MLKRWLLALGLLAGAAGLAEAATVAVATGNVNLRAGPSTAYPVVTVVPAGARIVTHGCLEGYSWCDIAFGGARGWVAANYIRIVDQGAPVVLTPGLAPAAGIAVVAYNRAYWDTYYAAYPWYRPWPAYGRYPAARVTDYDRSVNCADGSCTATRSATGVYGGTANQTRTCADGSCTATRNVTGPAGNSASRVRHCSANDRSCTVTRTGPQGASATRTRALRP